MSEIIKSVLSFLGFDMLFVRLISILKLPSSIILIIVNLIPIFGVVIFNWNAFDIIILYWVENIVIGIFNALRILFAQGTSNNNYLITTHKIKQTLVINSFLFGSKIFLTIFFCIHYGIFTVVHGGFVFMLFGVRSSFLSDNNLIPIFGFFFALLLSKGFSFLYNYLYKGEYLKTFAYVQMFAPYGRIIVIHTSIFIIGFLSILIPIPSLIILVFILLKIVLDLGGHFKAHAVKS